MNVNEGGKDKQNALKSSQVSSSSSFFNVDSEKLLE